MPINNLEEDFDIDDLDNKKTVKSIDGDSRSRVGAFLENKSIRLLFWALNLIALVLLAVLIYRFISMDVTSSSSVKILLPGYSNIPALDLLSQENDLILPSDGGLLVEPDSTTQEANIIYVASKNGKKYHLSECSGAKNIKEENKIYFASRKLAEEAGYTPAANCPGL